VSNTSYPSSGLFVGPQTSVSLLRRFCALFIDWTLCRLVSVFFTRDLIADPWVPAIVLVLEYAFFIGLFTQTPGMWIARIRCVFQAGGGRIGVPRAFVRGLLVATFLPAVLGWQDRAVGSVIQPVEPATEA
jgi:uncharacterized RDD family membrane protein YckC